MNLSVLIPVGGELEEDEWRWRSFQWLQQRYEALLPNAEIILGTSDMEPYNRSQARNNAFAQSTRDLILVADADTAFNMGQITKAMQMITELGAPWVICYDEHRYYNLGQEATAYLIAQDPTAPLEEPPANICEHVITSWAGLVMLPRAAWEKVGGYDERFVGWGYEDNGRRFALEHAVGPYRRVTGTNGFCVHMWHPAPEESRFGQPNIAANRALCRDYERGRQP